MRGYVRLLDLDRPLQADPARGVSADGVPAVGVAASGGEGPAHIPATSELVHVEPSIHSSLRHAYRHSVRTELNSAVFLDGVLSLKSAAEFQAAQVRYGYMAGVW